tara:strand:- start:67 stop:444 length:378 start_codon:yes stop_codon:yes gene_type:complete
MKYKLILIFITILFSCGVKNERVSKPSSKLTISPGATTLLQVITGRFPGVTVIGDKVLIRGGSLSINNQAYAIYDVDGNIYTDFPSFIDPQMVKSISILKSLAATNKYGGIARGGAIVIKLKANQ